MNDQTDLAPIDDMEIEESMMEFLDALAEAMPGLSWDIGGAPDNSGVLRGTIDVLTTAPVARLVVQTDTRTAMKLAEGWDLTSETGPSEQDARDAMSEFTNIAGGSMKFLIDDESSLGLPTIASLQQDDAARTAPPVTIHHAVGTFRVELALTPSADA